MTVSFVPGDVNTSRSSVAQGVWKHRHVIVYGSGNNVVVYGRDGKNAAEHLQTLCLAADADTLAFNESNGLVCVGTGAKFVVYTPTEHLKPPRWTACLERDLAAKINTLRWAPGEDELIVATSAALSIYHIYEETATWKASQRWSQPQANPVTFLDATYSASKMATVSGGLDMLVKVWNRNSYDCNTSFELLYLDHPARTFVKDLRWSSRDAKGSPQDLNGSLARIEHIRHFIGNFDEEKDILYTFASDLKVRVWITYEIGGHKHMRCSAELDLSNAFGSDRAAAIGVIPNRFVSSALASLFPLQDSENTDLLLAASDKGQVLLYLVKNLRANPPSVAAFEKLARQPGFLDENWAGVAQAGKELLPSALSAEYLGSSKFEVYANRISLPEVCFATQDGSVISVLVHDRVAHDLRFEAVEDKALLNASAGLGAKLVREFQGHPKSIQKLIKSENAPAGQSVILSVLNFAKHNYLLKVETFDDRLSVSKEFQIDLRIDGAVQGIWNAAIFADVDGPGDGNRRHHLVVAFEKSGYVSLWDAERAAQQSGTNLQEAKLKDRVKAGSKSHQNALSSSDLCSPASILAAQFEGDCFVAAIYPDKSQQVFMVYNHRQLVKCEVGDLPIEGTGFLSSAEEGGCLSLIDTLGTAKVLQLEKVKLPPGTKSPPGLKWKQKIEFQTNIVDASHLHGSSPIHKFAVIHGATLYIWDTLLGILEYEETFKPECGPVKDLDWTFVDSTSDKLTTNAILSVGFSRFVLLYSQLRFDYINKIPAFAVIKQISIAEFTPHEIGDSEWLDNGHLIIACGNQIFIDDRRVDIGSDNFVDTTIRQLLHGQTKSAADSNPVNGPRSNRNNSYDILSLVRLLNDPLPFYHPQFLVQTLLWCKIEYVKKVLARLFYVLKHDDKISWDLSIPLLAICDTAKRKDRYEYHAEQTEDSSLQVTDFSDDLADVLIQTLTRYSLPLLTRHQQITLTTVIKIVRSWSQHAETLDANGMRFYLSFRLFEKSIKQSDLSMRDVNWAIHSRNQDILVSIVRDHCKLGLRWDYVKATRMPYWVEHSKLGDILEECAKGEFSEKRDPSGFVSLIYVALRKKQLIIGLWRTVQHAEKEKMLKFLSNDFTQPRWKSAAVKNGFALMSKHRFADAAYFFLLGDSVQDCCNTIAGRMNNLPLATAIAKVYDCNAVRFILENYVVPEVHTSGDRWTTSWLFWEIGYCELSLEALVKLPAEMFGENCKLFSKNAQTNYLKHVNQDVASHLYTNVDPVLAILYASLQDTKELSKQRAYGVTPGEEMDFVYHNSLLYNRMGCDLLALLLMTGWKFIPRVPGGNTSHRDSASGDTASNTANNTALLDAKNPTLPDALQKSPFSFAPAPQPTAFEEPDMSAFEFGF